MNIKNLVQYTLILAFFIFSINAQRILFLFDCDGTLTLPRKRVSQNMLDFLKTIRSKVDIGVVGGSDYIKIAEQMTPQGAPEVVLEQLFNYVFSENGLVAYSDGALLQITNLKTAVSEARLNQFLATTLYELSQLEIPVRRGTFIEFRNGLINICPVGRSCSQEEREAFEQYDKIHNIRPGLVERLAKLFPEFTFSIGGQISIDAFPKGWDKTFCLRFVADSYDEIHFWGDKTAKGGNDYEIYTHPRVNGHTTTSPEDTMAQVEQVLKSK